MLKNDSQIFKWWLIVCMYSKIFNYENWILLMNCLKVAVNCWNVFAYICSIDMGKLTRTRVCCYRDIHTYTHTNTEKPHRPEIIQVHDTKNEELPHSAKKNQSHDNYQLMSNIPDSFYWAMDILTIFHAFFMKIKTWKWILAQSTKRVARNW